MFEDLQQQIGKEKVIETYRHLRGLFNGFKGACEKVLAPENYFGARFEDIDHTEFFIYVFDIPVRVMFSFVQNKNDKEFNGRMVFQVSMMRFDNVNILSLYFDRSGNIKETINQKMNFRSLEKPEDIEYVLWSIVAKLIELPFFERV